MDLSVVIVSWNTRDLLARCIRSLQASELPPETDILIVDNASSDGTASSVHRMFPDLVLMRNDKNVGFAAANNIALSSATGRYILLLNPDTEVQPGAVQALCEFLDANVGSGAVAPQLVGADGAMQKSVSPAPSLMREISRLFHISHWSLPSASYDMKRWYMHRPREVDVVQGACMMIRREALYEVGLLDEDYFMYTEEVDLCHRLRKAGWTVHWLPTAKVRHHGSQSSKQVPTESFLNLYKSKIIYFRKHHGVAAAAAYKLILATASIARLIATPFAFFEPREQRERHMALADRYRRLLLEMPSF